MGSTEMESDGLCRRQQRNVNLFLAILGLAAFALHFELPRRRHGPTNNIKNIARKVSRRVISSHRASEEGIGSAIQDIKYTLVITALLKADLHIPMIISQHGYDTSSFLMTHGDTAEVVRGRGKECALDDRMSERTIKVVVRQACASASEFKRVSKMLRTAYADCSVVRDFNFTQPRTEEFNACTAEWMRERLLAASGKRRRVRRDTSLVVYHNRAGDMGQGELDNRENARVLRPEDARAALDRIQSKMKRRMRLLVISEDKNMSHYDAISDYNFKIANGNNWLEEISQTAGAQAAVLSESSFSVLIAQVSGARLIYAKAGRTKKFTNFESFGVTLHKLGKRGDVPKEGLARNPLMRRS